MRTLPSQNINIQDSNVSVLCNHLQQFKSQTFYKAIIGTDARKKKKKNKQIDLVLS